MIDNKKISFYGKHDITCPVCDNKFYKEELLSGGGRMNAGDLTDELHRLYIPTQKFGDIHPLIYPVTVCPKCLYSAYQSDFTTISEDSVAKLYQGIKERMSQAKNLFSHFDFNKNRTLAEGILSYILAIICYDDIDSSHQPIFKQGLSALRAAWLFNDYHLIDPDENFDYLRDIMYRKAQFFYGEMIIAEREEKENYEAITHFGPDIDHNNGFDGVLFLAGLLEYKYGPRVNKEARIASLKTAKIAISRIVGMGKASKTKTSNFVENARELHGWIKDELKQLGDES